MAVFGFLKTLFNQKKGKKKSSTPVKRSTRKLKLRVKKKASKAIKKKTPIKHKNKKIKGIPFKKPKKLSESSSLPQKIPEEKEIGIITHYFGKIEVGIIKLRGTLKIGDRIHIKGVHDDFIQTVKSLQYNHKDIAVADRGLEVGIRVSQPVHENDRIYKVNSQ